MRKMFYSFGECFKKIMRFGDDLLILAGAGCLIYATYLLSSIAAIYLLGVWLIIAGTLIGLSQRGNRNDHS